MSEKREVAINTNTKMKDYPARLSQPWGRSQ
jgi:hypothetical protein